MVSSLRLFLVAQFVAACAEPGAVGVLRNRDLHAPAMDAGSQPGEGGASAASCTQDRECAPNQHCYGPSTCGAIWSCLPGFSPCSAAAPFVACGCDGTFVSVAAGCPARHAWPASFLYMNYAGSPCAPDVPLAASDLEPLVLVYEGRDLASFDGVTVRVRIRAQQSAPPGTQDESAVIRDGAFSFTWSGSLGDRAYDSFNALTLFDLSEDGRCDPDEPIVMARIPNPFDLSVTQASLRLSPENFDDFATHCDAWNG